MESAPQNYFAALELWAVVRGEASNIFEMSLVAFSHRLNEMTLSIQFYPSGERLFGHPLACSSFHSLQSWASDSFLNLSVLLPF